MSCNFSLIWDIASLPPSFFNKPIIISLVGKYSPNQVDEEVQRQKTILSIDHSIENKVPSLYLYSMSLL